MMTMIRKKRIGIVILENFSIPRLTPSRTMPAVKIRKTVWARSGFQGYDTKASNIAGTASGSVANSDEKALMK